MKDEIKCNKTLYTTQLVDSVPVLQWVLAIDRGPVQRKVPPQAFYEICFFWKVIRYRYQRKVPALCNRQIFWPKGKKYILCTMIFFVLFMIFYDNLGHFRGGGLLLNFFLFEPLFLSQLQGEQLAKLQKRSFMKFSRNSNSMIFFLLILFFVKLYRCS